MVLTLAFFICALALTNRILRKRESTRQVKDSLTRQLLLIAISCCAAIATILALPINDTMKGQLFSLLGLGLTVVITLSSTTIVSNAMAGLMSRAIGSFKVGDFIRSNDNFGRVTERGLFHTEIQTEDRDLTTLPNLYLATHPISIIRNSGTVVSATVSLGYDVDHSEIEPLLIEAAKAILEDPFVRTMELGDFSVTYRIAGFLDEVTKIFSTRSKLNEAVLDALHGAGIEIASPNIMAQRPLPDGKQLVPGRKKKQAPTNNTNEGPLPEDRIFDKAERAAERERLIAEKDQLAAEIAAAEAEQKSKTEGETGNPVHTHRQRRINAIEKKLELMETVEAEEEASN